MDALKLVGSFLSQAMGLRHSQGDTPLVDNSGAYTVRVMSPLQGGQGTCMLGGCPLTQRTEVSQMLQYTRYIGVFKGPKYVGGIAGYKTQDPWGAG